MRMLVCGCGALDPRSMVRSNVVDSLRFVGHEVLVFDPTDMTGEAALAELTVQLRRYEPDVLIHVPTPGELSREQVHAASQVTSTVAVALHQSTVWTDAPTDLRSLSEDLWHYDLVTVPDRWTFEAFQGEGSFRLSLLEPAAHVPGLAESVLTSRQGVLAAGPVSPEAIDLVCLMLAAGLDVSVLGQGWKEVPLDCRRSEPLASPERGTLLAAAELLVELPVPREIVSCCGRADEEMLVGQDVLDAAAVGTPAVTLARPGLAAHFVVDQEILTYEGSRDLTGLVAMLQTDPARLQVIGEAACTRVASSHRWTSRWTEVFGSWAPQLSSEVDEDVRLVSPSRPLEGVTSKV